MLVNGVGSQCSRASDGASAVEEPGADGVHQTDGVRPLVSAPARVTSVTR